MLITRNAVKPDVESPPEALGLWREYVASLDAEASAAEFLRYVEDNRRLRKMLPELREKHPGSWVAMRNARVAAVEPTQQALFAALEAQGIDRTGVPIECLAAKREPRILPRWR